MVEVEIFKTVFRNRYSPMRIVNLGPKGYEIIVMLLVCVFVCVTPLQVSKGTGTVIISCFVGAYEIWAN